jgi:hypothetical protein
MASHNVVRPDHSIKARGAIGIVSPLISCRWRLRNPVLIAATAVASLIA